MMVKLLMIADDFTGSLDSGIQFAKRGIRTQVFLEPEIRDEEIEPDTEVLVVDTESRPLPKKEAYERVRKLTDWARRKGIGVVFKKTDSALRGNVGAELAAASEAMGTPLYFIPAHPKTKRITKNATHYVDGALLENSVFGKDPFEPVTMSYIPDIIGAQSNIPVTTVGRTEAVPERKGAGIVVFDAETEADISARLFELIKTGRSRLLAGCAALACEAAEAFSFTRTEPKTYEPAKQFYVACGSLNAITKEQVDYAEAEGGFCRIHLTMEQKLVPGYFDTAEGQSFLSKLQKTLKERQKVVVDSFDQDDSKESFLKTHGLAKEDVRGQIAAAHGRIVEELEMRVPQTTVLMTGSDTLMGYMKRLGLKQLAPVCEIEPGVVVSSLTVNGVQQQIISKSGGFGVKDTMAKIAEKLLNPQIK